MSRAFWGMLFGIALASGNAAAQETAPTGPVNVTTLPHPSLTDAATADAPGPPPTHDNPLIQGDTLVFGTAPCPAESWFVNLESDFLIPHFTGFLSGPVNIGGFFNNTVILPNAPLYGTTAPSIEVGFRIPDSLGEIVVGYRNLTSEGYATILNYDPTGNGDLKSRLNLNTLDLEYGRHGTGLGPCWDVHWRVGLRLLAEYHDDTAVGQMLEQHATNQFLGAGPVANLELWRHLDWHDLSLYTRVEEAGLVGQMSQSYEEQFMIPAGILGGTSRQSMTQFVPMASLEFGLSWTPPLTHRLQVTAGYEIEGWWYLARTDNGSRGNLTAQGLFLRGEWGY